MPASVENWHWLTDNTQYAGQLSHFGHAHLFPLLATHQGISSPLLCYVGAGSKDGGLYVACSLPVGINEGSPSLS